MRIRRAWVVTVALFALTALVTLVIWRTGFLDSVLRPFAGTAAFQSVTYVVPDEGWLRFAIPGAQKGEIKLISNAGVDPAEALALPPQEQPPFAEPFYDYALDYQVLDPGGRVIDEGRYHHRSQVLKAILNPGEQPQPVSRFSRQFATTPAGAQRFRIEFGDNAVAGSLRLRVAEAGPGVKEVVVRAFVRDIVPQHQVATRWLRLSRFQQENLADDILYSYELMYPDEKENLIRNRWRPIGPDGVGGRDYEVRRLYSLSEPELEYTQEPVVPSGVFVDARRRGVLPVPPGEGTLEIILEPFTPLLTATSPPQPVLLHWHGETAVQRATRTLADPARPLRVSLDFPPGLIEVEAHEPLVARLIRRSPAGDVELTPPPEYLRVHRIDPALPPLEFLVDHVGGRPTPFRLDLRTAGLRAPEGAVAARVHYALLDAKDRVLGEGDLDSSSEVSLYDRPAAAVETGWITEAASHYFALSANVDRIRLTSTAVVWAVAYTRVDDLPARVDAAAYLPWAPADAQLPFWFLTRPLETAANPDLRPTLLVDRQERPAEGAEEVAKGQYAWEAVRPSGIWVAREILAPLLPGQPVRDEALGAVFRPLPAGRDVAIDFKAEQGLPRVAPRLLYLRSDESPPLSVQLWIDDKQLIDRTVSGRSGELRVPTLDTGRHTLKLAASGPARWLISHTGEAEGAWLQRTAQRLTRDRPLKLDFDKRLGERETLSARVFLPGTETVAQLRVRVGRGRVPLNTALAGWTQPERLYSVAATPGETAIVLQAARGIAGSGRLFVALGADLPTGRYPIEVTLLDGTEAYVQFFRITPGLVEKRDVIKFKTEEG